jgi:hypothetical protein
VSMKTEQLKFRVLASDKQALRQIAQFEGESMAVVVRNLIRRRARELGLGRGPPDAVQGAEYQVPKKGDQDGDRDSAV